MNWLTKNSFDDLKMKLLAYGSQAVRNQKTHDDLTPTEAFDLSQASFMAKRGVRFLNRSRSRKIARRFKQQFETRQISWATFAARIRRLPSRELCEKRAEEFCLEASKWLQSAMRPYADRHRQTLKKTV